MRSLFFIVFCCLILSACSNERKTNLKREVIYKPTLDVRLDISGKQVTVIVNTDLKISSKHLGMAREPGEGHIHMYLDNGDKIVHEQYQFVLKDLDIGQHSLKVSLHNNDHTPFDVTKTIAFEIK